MASSSTNPLPDTALRPAGGPPFGSLPWGAIAQVAQRLLWGALSIGLFAGLWEGWRGADGTVMRTFTIVTTNANPVLRPLHERMPVILEATDWPAWLGEVEGEPAALLRPSAAELRVWRVGKAVGNVRNNGPALLEESKAGGDEAVPPRPPGALKFRPPREA